MGSKNLTKTLRTQLKTLRGQIDSVLKMAEENRSQEEVLAQLKSARSQMETAYQTYFDEVLRKSLALRIAELVDRCPGNCGKEDKVEFIRREFPSLEWDQLLEKLKEAEALGNFIESQKESDQSS